MRKFVLPLAASVWIGLATASTPVFAQAAAAAEQIAALKKSVSESQASLHHYEWIETTVISMKGEEKSRTQSRCYYDATGSLQKVEQNTHADQGGRKPRGLRGKIVEKKTEEAKYRHRILDETDRG